MSQLEQRIATLRKVEAEIAESIATIHYWNSSRTDVPEPIDIGFERCMLNYIRNEIEASQRGDIDSAKRWHDKAVELALSDEPSECLE